MKPLARLKSLTSAAHEKYLLASIALLAGESAHAGGGGGFSLPGFASLGCKIIQWLTGELSVYIFFIVVVCTLLIGFFAKMDWTKILGVIVLMGLLKGLVSLMTGTGFITLPTGCMAA